MKNFISQFFSLFVPNNQESDLQSAAQDDTKLTLPIEPNRSDLYNIYVDLMTPERRAYLMKEMIRKGQLRPSLMIKMTALHPGGPLHKISIYKAPED